MLRTYEEEKLQERVNKLLMSFAYLMSELPACTADNLGDPVFPLTSDKYNRLGEKVPRVDNIRRMIETCHQELENMEAQLRELAATATSNEHIRQQQKEDRYKEPRTRFLDWFKS
jgi:hypothetical protein